RLAVGHIDGSFMARLSGSGLPSFASAPGFLCPYVHGIVLVLPGRVHCAHDAGNASGVAKPLGNGGAVFIAIIVTGKDLPESSVGEEPAVLAHQAAIPVDDADALIQPLPGAFEGAVHRVLMIYPVMVGVKHIAPDPYLRIRANLADDLSRLVDVPGQQLAGRHVLALAESALVD